MKKFKKGDFVEMDGLLAMVVATDIEDAIPEEHLAIWFGDPNAKRKSDTEYVQNSPEVWTVPEELCNKGLEPVFKH